jgi:hypothetical protein
MVVIVYENALTDINCSDLFQSETVPYDWEEHEFEHDGTTSDTREHSGNNGKAATELKQRGQAFRKDIITVPVQMHQLLHA